MDKAFHLVLSSLSNCRRSTNDSVAFSQYITVSAKRGGTLVLLPLFVSTVFPNLEPGSGSNRALISTSSVCVFSDGVAASPCNSRFCFRRSQNGSSLSPQIFIRSWCTIEFLFLSWIRYNIGESTSDIRNGPCQIGCSLLD